MKPTLEEIIDNYERVLLQLHNGHLAGIKKDNSSDCYTVVEQQDWVNHGIYAIELEKGYKRESTFGYNIDKIKFLADRYEVNEFLQYEECEIEWDWDINNPHNLKFKKGDNEMICDDQRDEYEYVMQYLNLTKVPYNRDYIIKGENKTMNNILDIYGDRKREKINKHYEQLMELTKLADERYAIFKDCSDKLDKLYKEDGIITNHLVEPQLAEKTQKHLKKLAELREEEYCKLENLMREVHAQLSMCETYEQKQNVLNTYKILKANGKVNA